MLENAQVDRIRQIPGIGLILAHTIPSEIGDIQRFKSAKALCSFAGLAPTVRASAEHVFYGRLTKQGSRWLRWALIEAAVHADGRVPQRTFLVMIGQPVFAIGPCEAQAVTHR